jgi:hypothetical protein
MYVLVNFDWYGSEEGLKAIDKLWEDNAKKIKGVEFKGRFGPYNLNYHWTMIAEAKDMKTWDEFDQSFNFKRDYKTLDHVVYEFYGGKVN